MALIETEALILKSYNLADADKIVVFLTRDHGLIRGVAKGAKRLKSKFGGSLEPFSVVHLAANQKEERELVDIRQVELIKSFFNTAGKPSFLPEFAYLVGLLGDFAPPNEPNEKLYKMAVLCLETGAENEEYLPGMLFYFEHWLLKLGGYLPDWTSCGVCHRKFDSGETASLQPDYLLLCENCGSGSRAPEISLEQREIFFKARKLRPAEFIAGTIGSAELLKEMSFILRRIISRVLDREIVEPKGLTSNIPIHQ